MTDPYKVLGISRDATDIEVKNAYRALVRKYHPDNFSADNPLADLATEKMKEINEAYNQIQKERATGKGGNKSGTSGGTADYIQIRNMINARRFREAEIALSKIPESEQTADWHFLKCMVLMNRGYYNDAIRELEVACQMDPNNLEYQQAKQMFNQTAAGYGQNYSGNARYQRSSADTACDICNGLICADCCCECMGGDLISCC